MARFVLDAYALMALIRWEAGGPKVEELLEQARQGTHEVFMTVVNLGEVLYTLERRGEMSMIRTMVTVDELRIQLVDADRDLALRAAQLKVATRLGYADCFAAACAQELEASVVTGDSDFRLVEDLVPVEWLS